MNTFKSLLIASLALFTSLQAAVDTGASAPAFTVLDSAGAEHSLSDFAGQYVVLEWTRHDCPFVVKYYENGDMQALQKEMTAAGVVWLQVTSTAVGKTGYLTAEELDAMRKSVGTHSTATLLDEKGEVGRAYGARTTPHMFLINPEGIVVYQGAIDSIKSARSSDIAKATNYVKAAYESAVAGEAIEKPTTPPYGCGVKY
ncbi:MULTISPECIES: redoxin domain-containing protein [unclassified Lentimonas]|uniref:redoxin domain-containing protein n=1 Tax=unclassified Lentimonas TaxID=2630993 RepID=UPI00132B2FF3|nr:MULTISPECIES: redoxin domain-containing protein [unclassified Lentimonas]CAA6678955.1 PPO candidate 1 [Lentimonas sp. CC4]CAA6685108.1 PPO candidate 1 [Lentimonas sp. CC6]CAA6696939.1 PPO candidate 1 [Lentimonas sp. CC19]CAA6697524.1 PPO candidate 1 [Lentimonas sp. CC10]CAA7071126.1 PPO candidate 1 [Lentimonas sp. CC11]